MKMDSAVGDGHAQAGRPHGLFRPGARGGYGLDLRKVFPLRRVPQIQPDGILPIQVLTVVCLRGGASRTSMAFLRP